MGLALQVAEHERFAILPRQPAQLLVEHHLAIEPIFRGLGRGQPLAYGRKLPLPVESATDPGPGARRDATAHAVEPRAQRVIHADGIGLAHQDQEGGLKGILGVMRVG